MNIEEKEPSAEVRTTQPPEPNTSSSPSLPLSRALNSGNALPLKSDDKKMYGFDVGGISSYVVPSRDPELEIVDALDVVPEYQIIEKGKKKKRLYLFGGIFLIVIILLVVIAVVVLSLRQKANNDTNFVTGINHSSTDSPSQAPSTSLATITSLDKLFFTMKSHYSATEQFETIFSDESSPQYRAAAWVADSASTLGVNSNDDRLVTRFALATFYFATNGDEWINRGRGSAEEWLTGANECDWYAIECNNDGSHITKISFPPNGEKSNNITGTLPYELSFLSKLAEFIVPRGPISGTFPDWSNLSTLRQLLLNDNKFEGTFPTYLIQQNPSLEIIHFKNSNFEGQLLQGPSPVISTALKDISVSGNNFIGPISSQINNFPSLKTLNVGRNGFTGTLPEELYNLVNLTSLDLSYTNLRGEISADLGALSHLISFRVGNTEMSGTLPTQLFLLTHLRKLDLSFGNFTGSLSESFATLTDLELALLHNNRFNGTIPQEFGLLPALESLELHANDLSGSVSEELCNLRGEGFMQLQILTVDCMGDTPKVSCTCCTNCRGGV